MAYTTINKSNLHFNTVLYTGNGSNSRGITGVDFQPDFVWNKGRDDSWQNILTDIVRGATKNLYSDSTNAEVTDSTRLQSFNSDGFTIGTNNQINNNSDTYVAWNWKAGGGQGSSNTDGSINTTYTSVNTTARFSISQYTGTGSVATVGHGLGVKPDFVIIKELSNANSWFVYHKSLGATHYLYLNDNDASAANSNFFQNTEPTSALCTIGTDNVVNRSSSSYIMYAFAEVQGFSKFGSYTGNGSEGAFIYTGFAPSFFMIKRTDSSGDKWRMWDNVRSPFNVVDDSLAANENSVEYDDVSVSLDFLSNGVKMKMTGGGAGNGNNETYVFMAFGQSIVGTNNLPSNAK